jgi:hypothetical protein
MRDENKNEVNEKVWNRVRNSGLAEGCKQMLVLWHDIPEGSSHIHSCLIIYLPT